MFIFKVVFGLPPWERDFSEMEKTGKKIVRVYRMTSTAMNWLTHRDDSCLPDSARQLDSSLSPREAQEMQSE